MLIEGWSEWDSWSPCPVTCGFGQRARRKVCLEDPKDEMVANATCRGVARQTERCDMGPCGSMVEDKFEGGGPDPVDLYLSKTRE